MGSKIESKVKVENSDLNDAVSNLPEPYIDKQKTARFIALPLKQMLTDAVIQCQLYLRVGPDKYVKYRDPNSPFHDGIRRRLQERRHTHIYIRRGDSGFMNHYLETNLNHILTDKRTPDREKADVLYQTTTNLIQQVLSNPRSKSEILRSRRIVESATEFILSRTSILGHLIELSSFDYYTYTHSIDVMTLSISVARRLGVTRGEDLIDIGQSALLHDIGKTYINPDVNSKAGPLTAEEYSEMKQHTTFGYLSLKSTGQLSDEVLRVVKNHHEDLRGNGYPSGLSGNEIDLNVRIVTCADIYNALTTRRVYRDAYRTFPALKMMKEWIGDKIDERVFREFVQMLGDV